MGERFLIDSNAVIYFLGEIVSEKEMTFLANVLDKECLISFITEIELLVGVSEADLEVLNQFFEGSKTLWINQDILDKTVEIRKWRKVKLPDAIIAATAIVHNLTLISYNEKDFDKIVNIGLKYFNPKSL